MPVGVDQAAWYLVPMASSTAADPLVILLNYGIAGVMIILFTTGQIRTKSEVADLRATIQEQSRLIEAMRAQLTGQTLPALTRSAQVLEALPSTEQALVVELRRTVARLEELSKPHDLP